MTEAIDPVTVALTGQLPFYLVLAAILTWPISLGLLQSLQTRGASIDAHVGLVPDVQGADSSGPDNDTHARAPQKLATARCCTTFQLPLRRAAPVPSSVTSPFGLDAPPSHMPSEEWPMDQSWRSPRLLADGLEILPLRFLFLFWVFAWPVVLSSASYRQPPVRRRWAWLRRTSSDCSAIGAVSMPNQPRSDMGAGRAGVGAVRSAPDHSPVDVPVAARPRGWSTCSDLHAAGHHGQPARSDDRLA